MTKTDNAEKDLKIVFKNKNLLKISLTHKSANQKENNEKLEFLGDRVLGLVLSKKLFDLYPNENEGILDKKFARLVNRKICCEIGWSIGLHKHIIIGDKKKHVKKEDEKIISDCCEALIGAIFIDQGFFVASNFILRLWKKNIKNSVVNILDHKTKLQEHSLKYHKKLPFYNLLSEKGPKHNPTYKILVSTKGSKKFVGIGNSKQQAEQDAARKLLKNLKIK
jgi:ribonuclease III